MIGKRRAEEFGNFQEKQSLHLWKVFPSPSSSIVANTYVYIAKESEDTGRLQLDEGEKISNLWLTFEDFVSFVEDDAFRDKQIQAEFFKMRCNSNLFRVFKEQLNIS